MEAMTPDEQARFAAAQAEIRALIKKLDVDDVARQREVAAAVDEVLTRVPRRHQRPLRTEFLKACIGETPPATERLCACGCGWPVTSSRPEAKYATAACRERAHRAGT